LQATSKDGWRGIVGKITEPKGINRRSLASLLNVLIKGTTKGEQLSDFDGPFLKLLMLKPGVDTYSMFLAIYGYQTLNYPNVNDRIGDKLTTYKYTYVQLVKEWSLD